MSVEARRRIEAACVIASALGFVALMAPAMALYHGGTWIDPRAEGHDFWRNFFCDLLHEHALDGQMNVAGSRFATAAMLALVAGLWPFWLSTAWLVGRGRLARVVRVAGVTSVVGLVAVPLTPSDRFGALHGVAVLVAAVPGLVATAGATAGLFGSGAQVTRAEARALGAIAAATLVTAAIDATLYARHMASAGAQTPTALPALQKVAAMCLLAWMLGVARAAWRAARPAGAPAAPG